MSVKQTLAIIGISGAVTAMIMLSTPATAERAVPIPAAKIDARETGKSAVAVLAGGCFWGMEAVFERVKGVSTVTSGYAGGTAESANYSDVSTETTSHAEAIRIVYDPAKISYATLLRIFFSVAHDPTQLNRQGPDTGTSYRSAVFAQTPEQAKVARAYIAQLGAAKRYSGPIVTRIESAKFYPAESYHQDFFTRNPNHPYIVSWDKPKVAAYRVAFPSLYKG
ncbi:MAG: peptide-methionine (S)-S-oxide reductase MsrA [Sphingomonadaceae bacterium]